MADGKLNLAVFISGGGSNLQALIDACNAPAFPAEIQVVIADRPGIKGIARAENAGISVYVVDYESRKSRAACEAAVQDALAGYDIDLICLAGFVRILTADFVNAWRGRIINTHPALLPRHGGEGMYGLRVHEAVLDAGDTESGASIHVVTPGCDEGPVILQARVPVRPDDTPETLAARVVAEEHKIYPEAVRRIAAGEFDPHAALEKMKISS